MTRLWCELVHFGVHDEIAEIHLHFVRDPILPVPHANLIARGCRTRLMVEEREMHAGAGQRGQHRPFGGARLVPVQDHDEAVLDAMLIGSIEQRQCQEAFLVTRRIDDPSVWLVTAASVTWRT